MDPLSRRELLQYAALFSKPQPLRVIHVTVHLLLNRSAHAGKGISDNEFALFLRHQERARNEYSVSGIQFQLSIVEGAYLRTQGYSEIPDRFLSRKAINVLITDSIGYDIDRDRTGGCSIGPHPRGGYLRPDPFYTTFLGLQEARDTTLIHEYAHHFTLDTLRTATTRSNFWADVRNDYWIWRQRHGTVIPQFRGCANAPWAKLDGNA
jgi:hypothetical protein